MNQPGFKLLRPPVAPGQCADCAVFHAPNLPHNRDSLFYQYSFYEQNGRWPTWADAMAHCSDEMKAAWVAALAEKGVTV